MKESSKQESNNVVNGREILRFFSPRWFIAIMGTGAVANILQLLSGQANGFLHGSAAVLLLVAIISFPQALGLLLSRFWVDRSMLIKELEHSSLVQFYSAIFISAAVCATGLIKIPLGIISSESSLVLAKFFWGFSLGTGIALALFTPWRIITLNHGELRRILGFWFLPPVGLFVLVFAGNFLALKTGDNSWINNMAVLNALLIGIAGFLSLMLFTLFLMRALAFPFPRMDVVPSFTIGLAPVGVSIIALLSYLPVLAKADVMSFIPLSLLAPLVKFISVLLWGFGFWWMLLSLFIALTATKRKGIPITLGYWAFIFPPAAYSLATLVLGQATGLGFIQFAGQVLGYTVLGGWFVVSLLTIRGIFNRSIFNLPLSFSEILQGSEISSKNFQVSKSLFQDKFPVFSVDIRKNGRFRDLDSLVEILKQKIMTHPIARHIADFDHFTHTKDVGGDIPKGLRNAINIVFCFGPKIEENRMMAVRPRSFGIAEYDEHFTISFLEAPSPKATQTMKDWMAQL
jgi:tellurite resistance protein TehA-like permease